MVLERARIGETWLSQRWDSFHFNIPRVLTVLPGESYEGSEPEGAMTRDEFVSMLEGYVVRHSLRRKPPGKLARGYLASTWRTSSWAWFSSTLTAASAASGRCCAIAS